MKRTSHAGDEQRKLAEAVVRVARSVRRALQRSRAPADLDDVEQDAAVGALVAAASGRFDTTRKPDPYLRRAAIRSAGLGVSQHLSVVSFPKKRAATARSWQHRLPVDGCGYSCDDDAPDVHVVTYRRTPEDAAAACEDAPHARDRADAFRALVARHQQRLRPQDRLVVEVVFGTRTTPAASWAEVRYRTGVSENRAQRVVEAFAQRLRSDAEAVRVGRAMMRDMEDNQT